MTRWEKLHPTRVVDVLTTSVAGKTSGYERFAGWINGRVLARSVWRLGRRNGKRRLFKIV